MTTARTEILHPRAERCQVHVQARIPQVLASVGDTVVAQNEQPAPPPPTVPDQLSNSGAVSEAEGAQFDPAQHWPGPFHLYHPDRSRFSSRPSVSTSGAISRLSFAASG